MTSISEKSPPVNVEVILFNSNWICHNRKNENYNPRGIRIGFIDEKGDWTSAFLCNYDRRYYDRFSQEEESEELRDDHAKEQIPTHWMEILIPH